MAKFEGSSKDMREDKKLAKEAKMPLDKFEKSDLDTLHDKAGGLRKGGKMAEGGKVRGSGAAVRGMKYKIY
jgi:hypothetical protein